MIYPDSSLGFRSHLTVCMGLWHVFPPKAAIGCDADHENNLLGCPVSALAPAAIFLISYLGETLKYCLS